MCGISGAFNANGLSPDDPALVARFGHIMRHRGPDDEGLFSDDVCALGHRRLAIIDLSSDGHQPFASPDGRLQLVFNGEIYNYVELRDELRDRGRSFRTRTDTEVLLAAYQEWGPDCLRRFNGMFAFAIYDTRDKSLFLARDRFGIKPLYCATKGDTHYFASEIKALRAIPGLSRAVNEQALFDYFVFNRTDIHDETFSQAIHRLPKGHWLRLQGGEARLARWWSPRDFLTPREEALEQAARTVEELVVSSVALRMRSDVPVGSCLSGGLDSSILVGILFDRLGAPAQYPCFTAVFPGQAVDESAYVTELGRRYPFRSLRTTPTADAALAGLEAFTRTNDEPTTSASFYVQYEVMRLAREAGVVVLLDGQGGDENFAGYQYFHGFHLHGLWQRGQTGAFLAELSRVLVRAQHRSALETLVFQMLPPRLKAVLLKRAVPWLAPDFFQAGFPNSRIMNNFFQVNGLNESLCAHFEYKLEHLLRMEDRNSMAFSLEARVPYLDYRLVEYLLGVSSAFKIRLGETKWLQKKSLSRYTIANILERKDKIGFDAPMDAWMRTPGWESLAAQAFESLKREFPGLIRKKAVLPRSSSQRWKLIQLYIWTKTGNADAPLLEGASGFPGHRQAGTVAAAGA